MLTPYFHGESVDLVLSSTSATILVKQFTNPGFLRAEFQPSATFVVADMEGGEAFPDNHELISYHRDGARFADHGFNNYSLTLGGQFCETTN